MSNKRQINKIPYMIHNNDVRKGPLLERKAQPGDELKAELVKELKDKLEPQFERNVINYNAAIERERKLEATIISHKEMKEKTEDMVKKLRTTFPIAGRDQQVATMIKVLKKHIKDTNKEYDKAITEREELRYNSQVMKKAVDLARYKIDVTRGALGQPAFEPLNTLKESPIGIEEDSTIKNTSEVDYLKEEIEMLRRNVMQLEEDKKCSICFKNPKNHCLPCGHAFCEGCLENLLANSQVRRKCPTCRKRFRVHRIRKLFL